MRKWMFVLIGLVPLAQEVSAEEAPRPRLLTVNGQAEIKVVPDEVEVVLGAESWNMELAEAKADNDARTRKILVLAERLNIARKDVQTDFISVEPKYNDRHDPVSRLQIRETNGYYVRKTVVITLREIAKFEELISGALKNGANYVHGVSFRTTRLRKFRDQARIQAVKAARDKADLLAKEMGCSVGKPQNVSEGSAGWYSPYNHSWGNRGMGAYQNITNFNEGQRGASEGVVALGQIGVNSTINASYEMECR